MMFTSRLLAVFLALSISALPQKDDPKPVNVEASIEVETDEATLTGRLELVFEFKVVEAPGRPLEVLVEFQLGSHRHLMSRDHVPPTPTTAWKTGETIRYALPATFPTEADLDGASHVDVYLAFRDPATKTLHRPLNIGSTWQNKTFLVSFEPPVIVAAESKEAIAEILARASELAREGRKADAWSALETALRATDDDSVKRQFRDAMTALGDFAMRSLNRVEARTVERRIADEKTRYLRLIAGRMFDRGRYHGSLAILDEIGGKLSEDGQEAVLGALDDASRNERDRQDTKNKLLDQITPEDKAIAEKEQESLDRTERLLEKARGHVRKKRYSIARAHLRALRFAEKQKTRDVAYRELHELEKTMLAAMPADQRAEVDAAINHPVWARTKHRASRHFIFIGPEKLIEGMPDDSILRFDLSYVFLTDLFGRKPNPNGDRLTVYFKELWDFGGGVGGGVTIDIGRAKPDEKKRRIDNGLMYHELTHCIDDTRPIHHGFREGLADFGATYTFEALGQQREAKNAFRRHLASFERDYLRRDLEYWRMPQYSPSAGFFLGFVHRHGKAKGKGKNHDWSGYRRFFRTYRRAPVRDGREHAVIRLMAVVLVRSFGKPAFDDLVKFRFPLQESDREAIMTEWEAFLEKDFRDFEDTEGEHPNSPLPRDRIFAEIERASRRRSVEEEDLRDETRERLGMIYEWRVIGPFRSPGVDPDACVFPPEEKIDLDAEYKVESNICRWQSPGPKVPVKIAPTGWVSFHYPYQDDTAIYALSNVRVPKECDVRFHLRADDDVSLFVNDVLVGKYRSRGNNDSSWLPWRGPRAKAPDAIVFPARLAGGRNKILVKVRNRGGAAGFVLAVTDPENEPLAEWWADSGPPARPANSPDRPDWKQLTRHTFSSRSAAGKLEVVAGGFKVKRKSLEGTSTSRGVGWRRFTVRPGFPKDSPSNLFWLKDRETRKLRDDVRATLRLRTDGKAPKVAITLMGDGSNDGLAGLTLIVHPKGKKGVAARLERYDRLIYQCGSVDMPKGESVDLVFEIDESRATVKLGDAVLFDRRPVRVIPERRGVGVSTWGKEPRIESLSIATRPQPRR